MINKKPMKDAQEQLSTTPEKQYFTGLVDMNTGKKLENGHIVVVKYIWNSYVGEIISNGLVGALFATGALRHAFFSPHQLEPKNTYQIISHTNPNHEDYNEKVLNWYKSEEGECPVKITIYDKK